MASRKAFLVRNLEDVEAYFPDNGDSLTWVAASGKWMPVVGGGGVTVFTGLTDTPANYTAASGKYVRVNDAENALIFEDVVAGAGTFLDLTDTPSSFAGQDGKVPTVNAGEDALEFTTLPVADSFKVLVSADDTTENYLEDKLVAGSGVTLLTQNPGGNENILITASGGGGGGASAFTDLSDVPSDYTTFSGYAVKVNSAEDGLEFIAPSAGGATSLMGVVNTNWDDQQDAHTADNTWEYITNCSGIITTEEDDGIIRCDWNGVIKYDDSNWEYFYLRFQLDGPDGTVYSPTMTHQTNSGATTHKYRINSMFFVWSGMPAGDYTMRPQVILTSNMNASFYARTGSIRGDWPVEGGGGGGGGGVTEFTALTDTPSDYTDDGEKFVKVNVGETALEFVTVTIPDSFVDLDDTPANFTSASGKYARVNDAETALIFDDVAGGGATFTSLTDTPSSFAGEAGKSAVVNDAETALEFVTVSGGGGGGGGLLASFRAQLSAQYDITDDWNVEKLPFDSVDFETSGGYYDETTNYRWTPPSGICNISVITDWLNVNTSNVWAYIFKNDANIAHGRINRYEQSVSVDIWDECNGTDYYDVRVQMGSFAGAEVLDNAGTRFSGAVFTAP